MKVKAVCGKVTIRASCNQMILPTLSTSSSEKPSNFIDIFNGQATGQREASCQKVSQKLFNVTNVVRQPERYVFFTFSSYVPLPL